MSLLSSLLAGASGLGAATAGTNAAAHNVSNAATPGYRRRSLAVQTAPPITLGGAARGLGVRTLGTVRAGSILVSDRRVAHAGVAAGSAAQARTLSAVERFFGNEGTGSLRGAMDALNDALIAATSNPADGALRRRVAAAAQDVAVRMGGGARRIAESLQSIDEEAIGLSAEINAKLADIAELDELIAAGGGRLATGDLQDRRDNLVYEVAELLGVRAEVADDGTAVVTLGGHALVADGRARRVDIGPAADGTLEVRLQSGAGTVDVTDEAGGEVGGLLAAREIAAGYVEDIDTVVVAFADAFNARHQAGFDRQGRPGQPLFSYDPSNPAATLTFDTGVLDEPDRLAFAADPAANAGDAGNLEALIAQQDELLVGASQSFGDALSELGARVGGDVRAARAVADQQGAIAEDLEELHQSLVGVNLDEEAAKLMEYQAAYQAAAKVVQTTDRMIGILMELV